MNNKETAKYKDLLLNEVLNNFKSFDIAEFSKKHKVHIDTTTALLEYLRDLGFISLITVSSKTNGNRKAYLTTPDSKGYFFLNEDGGFVESYKIQRRQRIWNIIKIAAAVINAIIIISIACIGIYFQSKSNKLEIERDTLKLKLEKIESLKK